LKKVDLLQREHNHESLNPDAQFKQLAFSTILEQQGAKIMAQPGQVNEAKSKLIYDQDCFERWYLKELNKDEKRAPRPIDEDDYRRK